MLTLYFRCRHSSTKVYAGFLTPFWKRQNPHDQRILTKSSADIREHGKQPRQIAEMAKRANATTVEVNASHVAYMSHPKEAAKLIEEAAAGVKR